MRILLILTFIYLILSLFEIGTEWMESFGIFFFEFILNILEAFALKARDQALNEKKLLQNAASSRVLRNGIETKIDEVELLVGDIVLLQAGDSIPVDGILIEGEDFQSDESAITGEGEPVYKSVWPQTIEALNSEETKKKCPFLLGMTKVVSGRGTMLACTVGENIFVNGLLSVLVENQENPESPIVQKIQNMVKKMVKVVLVMSVLTFFAMLSYLFAGQINDGWNSVQYNLKQIVWFLMMCVIFVYLASPKTDLIIVVADLFVKFFMKSREDKILIRIFEELEISAGIDELVIDKTGTLTQNQMKVTALIIENQAFQGDRLRKELISEVSLDLLAEACCSGNHASIQKTDERSVQYLGSQTDCALLDLISNFGRSLDSYQTDINSKVIKDFPFTSKLKKSTTVHRLSENKYRIYIRGASEIILSLCTKMIDKNGKLTHLREEINRLNKDFLEKSMRMFAMAYKDVDASSLDYFDGEQHFLGSEFTLIAITGIMDVLRPEARKFVKRCTSAGINVRMITGDNLQTAIAIAKEANIISPDDDALLNCENRYFKMEGAQFSHALNAGSGSIDLNKMNAFKDISGDLKVLARAAPEDKQILVSGLRQLKKTVAVVGDGTNDVPAVRKADVSFGMETGSGVLKSAVGIILLDDNLNSVLSIIIFGRHIYETVRRYSQFQITLTVVSITTIFIGVASGTITLSPVEFLWICLIAKMTLFALKKEDIDQTLIERPLERYNDGIVTDVMKKSIIGQSLYQIGILCFGLFYLFSLPFFTPEFINLYLRTKSTLFFETLVFFQIFNFINCRKIRNEELNSFKGIHKNTTLVFMILLVLTFQFLMVHFLGFFVKTSGLTLLQHLACLALGGSTLVVNMILKAILSHL